MEWRRSFAWSIDVAQASAERSDVPGFIGDGGGEDKRDGRRERERERKGEKKKRWP